MMLAKRESFVSILIFQVGCIFVIYPSSVVYLPMDLSFPRALWQIGKSIAGAIIFVCIEISMLLAFREVGLLMTEEVIRA